MEHIISYVEQLIGSFGWWTLAIVGATFLIMIPINLLIKLIFKKCGNQSMEESERLLVKS